MSENERRSMDDVMASIRRIIRSEKSEEPNADEAAPQPSASESEEGDIFSLTQEMMDKEPDQAPEQEKLSLSPNKPAAPQPEEEPLVLDEAIEEEPMVLGEPDPEPEDAEPMVLEAEDEEPMVLDAPNEEPMVLEAEEAAIVEETPAPEAPVEEILDETPVAVEPVAETPPAAPAMDEAALEALIKRVIQQELMGEIGQNISANVQRLIEAEVERRLADKG